MDWELVVLNILNYSGYKSTEYNIWRWNISSDAQLRSIYATDNGVDQTGNFVKISVGTTNNYLMNIQLNSLISPYLFGSTDTFNITDMLFIKY